MTDGWIRYRPMNWSSRKKMTTIIIYGLTASGASFNSALFSSASTQVATAYHVSTVVTSLATTMILLGFAFGPLVWGPLSELYGRKYVVLLPYLISACFAFGCGAAADIQTILITRFFQGFFSSSVITNTGGVLGDIYPPKDRGTALVIYSLSVVGGPLLSPIVGSAIVTSRLGWRWTGYIVGISQGSISEAWHHPLTDSQCSYSHQLSSFCSSTNHTRRCCFFPRPGNCDTRPETGHFTPSTKNGTCQCGNWLASI